MRNQYALSPSQSGVLRHCVENITMMRGTTEQDNKTNDSNEKCKKIHIHMRQMRLRPPRNVDFYIHDLPYSVGHAATGSSPR